MKTSLAQNKLKHSGKMHRHFMIFQTQTEHSYSGSKEENLKAAFGSLSLQINTKVQTTTSAKESAAGSYSMLPMNEKIDKKPNISKTVLS